MGLIDRFITSFRSEDRGIAEPPGLVQNDDGTVDYVRPDGSRTPIGNGGSLPAEWTVDANGGLTIAPLIPTSKALRLVPAVGATAAFDNIFEIYDDAGRTLIEIDAGGDMLLRSPNPGNAALFNSRFDYYEFDNANSRPLMLMSGISGFDLYTPSQSAFVLWKADVNQSPVDEQIQVGTDPDVLVFGTFNAAPPDNYFTPGRFAFWLDDTSGATKLMVKARSADGTYVTGQMALA